MCSMARYARAGSRLDIGLPRSHSSGMLKVVPLAAAWYIGVSFICRSFCTIRRDGRDIYGEVWIHVLMFDVGFGAWQCK